MKYLILATVFLIASCSSNTQKTVQPNKEFSDTSAVIEAFYVINGSTLALTGGPVKRVVMGKKVKSIDSVSEKGKMLIIDEFKVDTFYLLPNVDTTLVIMDSLKKPILDKEGKKQYQNSFRTPLLLPKQYLQETTITFPSVK